MKIEENIKLGPLTTFKIGGVADYFCRVKDHEDLKAALSFARKNKIPVFILGGGSNLVIGDEGFRGLVIKVEILGMEATSGEATAGAGENWDRFVSFCLSKKLRGLENLSGVPGTVGGAVVQNIGAYGIEVKEFVKLVRAVNLDTGEAKDFNNQECGFAYRDSFFKTDEGRKWFITQASFSLETKGEVNISYKDLAEYFRDKIKDEDISPDSVRQAVLEIRSRKFPPLDRFGTAGSFFKNPIIDSAKAQVLAAKYPGLPIYDAGQDRKKISLAWVIDRICGLKGLKSGQVEVSASQALVLISNGEASSKDVWGLAEQIKREVFAKTGVQVEFEVERV